MRWWAISAGSIASPSRVTKGTTRATLSRRCGRCGSRRIWRMPRDGASGRRDRHAHHASFGVCGKPAETQARRARLRVDEDGRRAPQAAASRRPAHRVDLYLYGGGVQHRAAAAVAARRGLTRYRRVAPRLHWPPSHCRQRIERDNSDHFFSSLLGVATCSSRRDTCLGEPATNHPILHRRWRVDPARMSTTRARATLTERGPRPAPLCALAQLLVPSSLRPPVRPRATVATSDCERNTPYKAYLAIRHVAVITTTAVGHQLTVSRLPPALSGTNRCSASPH